MSGQAVGNPKHTYWLLDDNIPDVRDRGRNDLCGQIDEVLATAQGTRGSPPYVRTASSAIGGRTQLHVSSHVQTSNKTISPNHCIHLCSTWLSQQRRDAAHLDKRCPVRVFPLRYERWYLGSARLSLAERAHLRFREGFSILQCL